MKRNLLAMVSACAVLAGAVFTGPTGVMAETITDSRQNADDVSSSDEIGSPQSIDTNVNLSNYQDDVIYSITITAGKMTFTYDYGAVWNPSTHTYTSKTGNIDGGWLTSELNGTNNKISVVNDSNYPVHIELSYEHNPEGEFANIGTEVKGVFGENKDCSVNPSEDETMSFDLNMETSKLGSNKDKYTYWVLADDSNAASKKDVYFKYDGAPDKMDESTQTSYEKAGRINITITPASNVEKKEPAEGGE